MITIKTMQMHILCGSMYITRMMTNSGIKVQAGSTTQAYIICKELLETTMFCLLMMQLDIVKLDIGKLKLIRKLCLLLSPAPPPPSHQEDKQTQTPPPRPPPPPLTPRPDSRPQIPENSHNKPTPREEGTDADRPVEPGERPKRGRVGDRGPSPGRGRGRGRGSDPDLGPNRLSGGLGTDQDPDPEKKKCPESQPPPEGEVEGHPPPPPPPPNGHNGHEEGAVGGAGGDGHPPPPPPPPNGHDESQSLLGSVASLLVTWESHFNQLVQEIQEDLEGYWTKLSIPQ